MKKQNFSLLLIFALIPLMACSGSSSSSNNAGRTSPSNATLATATATGFQLRLGTRWMAATALQDIFGATTIVSGSTTVKDITTSFIVSQPASWGGPCDPYANSLLMPTMSGGYVQRIVATTSPRGCSDTSFSQSSILPGASTSRIAWTIRACDRLVASDAAVTYAATQAGNTASINSAPTDALIRSTYDMFYAGAPLSDDAFTALKAVVSQAASSYPNTPDAWRYLLLTVCSSPGWHIL